MTGDDLQLVALGVLAWWLVRKRPDVGEAVVEDLVPAPKATVAALQRPRPPAPAPPASPADLLPPPKIPDALQATGDDYYTQDPLAAYDASKGFAGGGGGQSGGAGAGGSV